MCSLVTGVQTCALPFWLLAFGAPPVLALRRVPALRVLRRDLDPTEPSAWLVALTGLAGLGALLWWKAGSATLGTAMLAGIVGTFAVLARLGEASCRDRVCKNV